MSLQQTRVFLRDLTGSFDTRSTSLVWWLAARAAGKGGQHVQPVRMPAPASIAAGAATGLMASLGVDVLQPVRCPAGDSEVG